MQWERVLLPGIPEASEVESFLGVFDVHTRLTQIDTADFTPELILVGGSVSVEFAVRTIELVRQKWKGLQSCRVSKKLSGCSKQQSRCSTSY
jgi:hypothetical protein